MTDENDEAGQAADQARIRDDALSVLRDARTWCLTPAEWTAVEAVLRDLGPEAGGLDLADARQRKALEDATVRLELVTPRRIDTVNSAEPAPPDVRERLNVLVEELSGGGGKDSTRGGNG